MRDPAIKTAGPRRSLRVAGGRRGSEIASRRKRILDVAAEMIVSGSNELSMRRLAAEAGVSVTTIYNLIGNQESVLVELVRRPALDRPRRKQGPLGDDPLGSLLHEVENFAESMEDHHGAVVPAVRALMQLGYAELRRGVSPVIESVFLPGLKRAIELGHLRSSVTCEDLVERLASLGILAILDWAAGLGGHAEFHRRCIGDFIIVVLSGASKEEQPRWEAKLNQLTSGRASMDRKESAH